MGGFPDDNTAQKRRYEETKGKVHAGVNASSKQPFETRYHVARGCGSCCANGVLARRHAIIRSSHKIENAVRQYSAQLHSCLPKYPSGGRWALCSACVPPVGRRSFRLRARCVGHRGAPVGGASSSVKYSVTHHRTCPRHRPLRTHRLVPMALVAPAAGQSCLCLDPRPRRSRATTLLRPRNCHLRWQCRLRALE